MIIYYLITYHMKNCIVEDCQENYYAKELCRRHYQCLKRSGVPQTEASRKWMKGTGEGFVDMYGYRKKWDRRRGRNNHEHRLIMEQHLGRKLKTEEHIHHINHDKLDNRIENLKIVDNVTHKQEHTRKYETGEKQCSKCRIIKKLECFKFRLNNPKSSIRHRFYDSWCKQCCTDVRREWRHRVKRAVI
jgi:hypothetical protein